MRWVLIGGSWLAVTVVISTTVLAWRMWAVPAGDYAPWHRAWFGLVIACGSLLMLFFRNALIISWPWIDDWVIVEWLMTLPARVAITNIAAFGLLGCAFECYRIFRHRHADPAVPVAQAQLSWHGMILTWSPAATTLLGWLPEEVIWNPQHGVEKTFAQRLLPKTLTVPDVSGHTPLRNVFEQALNDYHDTGLTPLLNHLVPVILYHKDGREIQAELYITAHGGRGGTTFLVSMWPRPVAGGISHG